jgi:hypothetical protein
VTTAVKRYAARKDKDIPIVCRTAEQFGVAKLIKIDGLKLPETALVTPIPIGEDISSLSAILLNDDYYHFLRDGVRKIDGLPILDEVHLIPFKAKAWLELTEALNDQTKVNQQSGSKTRNRSKKAMP